MILFVILALLGLILIGPPGAFIGGAIAVIHNSFSRRLGP